MALKVFAIYDIRAERYNVPFFLASEGEALRGFSDLANDASTVIGKHPGDFKLVRLGVFDEINGDMDICEHVSLGMADGFVTKAVRDG